MSIYNKKKSWDGYSVSEHTPGPWDYAGSMNSHDLIIYNQADGIDQTLAMNGGPGYVATIRTREVGINIKSTEASANARLIAAAPDLLTALEQIAEIGFNNCSHQTMQSIARTALIARGLKKG